MVAACVIWGLSPLFYKLLVHVPPVEVVAHRTLWSLLIFSGWLGIQRRLREVPAALNGLRPAGLTALASLMISANWVLFIWSVGNDRVTEASLGYFLFPLVAVLAGRFVFGERLGPWQWSAVALAGLAVAVLTYGLGVPPWIALILSTTFGAYGVLKKQLALGPVVSVTAEVALLAPLAAAILVLRPFGPEPAFGQDWLTSSSLVLSGLLTASPLMLFSYAARRVKLATVGLLQYLNPTLQFLCAVVIFAEPFGPWHAIAFPMIWVALAVYLVSELVRDRAVRRASASASTEGTV